MKREMHGARYHPASPLLTAPVLAELVRSGDEKGMMIDSTFGIPYSPVEFFLPLWNFANYNLTLEEAPELQFSM